MAKNTLDVDRAREWLVRHHPMRECRDLAEILHDYSLTVFQPAPVDPRKEKIVKAMLVDERTSSRGLWPTDAAYFADKILAALDK